MSRDKQINFRLSEDDVRTFDTVADHYGVTVSVMIRMLVREKQEAITATQAPRLGPEREEPGVTPAAAPVAVATAGRPCPPA
jgi:hypothetical protein